MFAVVQRSHRGLIVVLQPATQRIREQLSGHRPDELFGLSRQKPPEFSRAVELVPSRKTLAVSNLREIRSAAIHPVIKESPSAGLIEVLQRERNRIH